MRRFVIYPVTALFPTVLPSLALSRALVSKETRKGESINGWRLSRYHFFALATIVMFIWFFIPNFLFQALHSFNWMTWFAPENFTLAMVTGFYGGLGYNPLATFDYNVAGTGKLTTREYIDRFCNRLTFGSAFFSTLQSTIGMIVSGLILIAMYWSNMYWTAYMPINSNQVFNNQGTVYNATHILDNGQLSIEKYKQYGPPMYAAYGIFEQVSLRSRHALTPNVGAEIRLVRALHLHLHPLLASHVQRVQRIHSVAFPSERYQRGP